jgi:putative ABC transport system permease protein
LVRLYHPLGIDRAQPATIAMRIRGGAPSTFSRRLSEIAASIDPELQVRNIVSMEEALHKEQWIRRMEALVLASIALSVLMLSCAGIYALMSFTVSQRRKEIGIRMALGADRMRIMGSIFSRALGQLAIGALLGVALAAMLENASDDGSMQGNAPFVLASVALFMVAIGLLAALGPARRCLSIEPTEALREQ